jgi:hypothetical protein
MGDVRGFEKIKKEEEKRKKRDWLEHHLSDILHCNYNKSIGV